MNKHLLTVLCAALVALLLAVPTADAKKKKRKKKKRKVKDEQAEKADKKDGEKDDEKSGWKAGLRSAEEDEPVMPEIEVVYATKRVKARKRPSKTSKRSFGTFVDERLHVIAHKEGTTWIRVRNAKGKVGWIHESSVERVDGANIDGSRDDGEDEVAAGDEVKLVDPDDPSISEAHSGPGRAEELLHRRGLEIGAEASLGISSYSRTFSSNGESALGGYTISAPSMSTMVSGVARQHIGAMFAAVRARFGSDFGAPGIRFLDEEGNMSQAQRFQVYRLGAAIELGATLGSAHPVRAGVSVGYELGYFMVEDVQQNPGLIAQEKVAAIGVGGNLATALTSDIIIAADLSWSPSVSLDQTVNLEDGTDSSVWALGGGARVSYLLDDSTTIDVGYGGRRTKYKFTGQSTRQFDVTSARRKDLQHTFTIGAARTF